MDRIYAKAYVEILTIINNMDEKYKQAIPKKLLEFFEKNKDNKYKFQINDLTLKNQTLLKETIGILIILEMKYWCKDEKTKIFLKQKLILNEYNYKKDLQNKYNLKNIFSKKSSN